MIESASRRDWFDWRDPDPGWVRTYAETPGLQWDSNGERITRVTLHRTHLPLVPAAVCGPNTLATPDHRPNPAMLRPYQAEDLPFMLSRRASLLCYEMRLGKQHPVDTKILTPVGWRALGDLVVGDAVIGSAGKPTIVKAVILQGVKPSYRVKFSDGSAVEAGPEHLWTVAYRAGGKRWQEMVLTTDQLRQRPMLDVNWDGQRSFKLDLSKTVLYLPMLRAPVEFCECSLPLPAYLVGQLVANGSLAHSGAVLVCNEADWPSIFESLCAVDVELGATQLYGRARRVGVPDIMPQLRVLGLTVLSAEKRIPPLYLRVSPRDRIALLQGLMDGDGSISARHNRVVYHTISAGLARDVQELVEGLGGIASVRTYDRTAEGKPVEYQVRMRLPPQIAPFRVPRKAQRCKPGSHAAPVRTVVSVEYVRDVESACISVDAPDSLYATEHCILTHNTVTACHVHNPRDGMLVVVGPLASRDVWCQWIEKVHGVTPIVLTGKKDIEMHPGFPAYFVHYDILDAHTKFFVTQDEIGTLIFDEMHLLQGRKTQRTAAANVLAVRASRIIGLSGTPMWSRPDSMYSLLHMISPGAWGGHFAYAKRYAGAMPGAHAWNYDGLSNDDELRQRLSEIIVRRTWQNVLGQLPPVVRVVEPVDVPHAEMQKVEMLAEEARLARGTTTVAGAQATLRRKMASLKVNAAVNTAVQATIDGHKPVVWAWHNQTAEQIACKISSARVPGMHIRPEIAVFRLQADDNQRTRDAIIASFRAEQGPAVMVASIAIGGVAIDLSCSDYAIFAEFDWTPANMYQAEMRTFHPTRPHTVVYLYADIPVEQDLVKALQVREGFAASVGLGSAEITEIVLSGRGASI